MKILVTGARGQLGVDCVARFSASHEVVAVDLPEVDIADETAVSELIAATHAEVVVNCAAFTDVDACETETEAAWRANVTGPRILAAAAARADAHLIHISTDYVFDGLRPPPQPYVEDDAPCPQSAYGRSKLAGEDAVRAEGGRAAIVRTAWLFGLHGRNFLKTMRRLASGPADQPLRVVNDQHGSPTWSWRLAEQLAVIAGERLEGVFHATGEGHCTWFELAVHFLDRMAITREVAPCTTEAYPRPAPRPQNSILENAALKRQDLNLMRPWQEDVDAFAAALCREDGE